MSPLLVSLFPMLLRDAPELLRLAFGSGADAVTDRIAKVAAEVFGTADAGAIKAQAAADPAKAEAFARKLQAETDALQAELDDRQDARDTTLALAGARSPIAWGAPVVSCAVTVGFIGILTTLTLHALPDSGVVNVLVGTLATAFGSVVNFWLGSSAGSQAKTQHLASLARAGTTKG